VLEEDWIARLLAGFKSVCVWWNSMPLGCVFTDVNMRVWWNRMPCGGIACRVME
jgi:hypothetical protein